MSYEPGIERARLHRSCGFRRADCAGRIDPPPTAIGREGRETRGFSLTVFSARLELTVPHISRAHRKVDRVAGWPFFYWPTAGRTEYTPLKSPRFALGGAARPLRRDTGAIPHLSTTGVIEDRRPDSS